MNRSSCWMCRGLPLTDSIKSLTSESVRGSCLFALSSSLGLDVYKLSPAKRRIGLGNGSGRSCVVVLDGVWSWRLKKIMVEENHRNRYKLQTKIMSESRPISKHRGESVLKLKMVRDFMGLNSKDRVFKKEALESCKEPGLFFSGVPVYSQLLKGIPNNSQPWYGSKVASVPAQLTIFYDGMMNVYDGISPEKKIDEICFWLIFAIMFLAGNGHFVVTADAPQPRTQAQGPTPMTPVSTEPCSPVSSPVSVSSHHVGQLTGGPANETEAAKRIMSSFEQGMQSAITQARKASLARFLEKRKERVMASAPYSLSKNIMDCASNSNAGIVTGE
ncbi:hypothetical protein L1987_16689 [Smallanthus sonchifolius]|uniref:Uncharacterized protein n=1 Tax=Smallanthus sonchifolius TaxID=185202 RepID=A0ACB9IUS2_9ASTR|nr:hypothetical protein L1987_16689 [Smallanthus sonchifolius]